MRKFYVMFSSPSIRFRSETCFTAFICFTFFSFSKKWSAFAQVGNVFRQICKISPIAMGLSVSVCVWVFACLCVAVSVTFLRTGHTWAKIENIKGTFDIEWRYCENYTPWPWPIFHFQMFNICDDISECVWYMWNSFIFECCRRAKIMKKKSSIHSKTFAIERRKSRFSHLWLDLYIRLQIFKICEIHWFTYVAG